MAHPKTFKRWHENGDHVVLNKPISPEDAQLTREHNEVIRYREDQEQVAFWEEKGYSLDKDPKAKEGEAKEEAKADAKKPAKKEPSKKPAAKEEAKADAEPETESKE